MSAGIHFQASLYDAWRINLHTRLASRILMRVALGTYQKEDDLYRLARSVNWEAWFDPAMTLRVDVSAQRSPLTSLNFITLRIKDAIVDRLREATGRRPSIDTRAPDVRVQAFLGPREATVYLDLSGESLFKRGWRGGEDDKGEAPLKENLAAGLIALAGWQPELPFYDPFCGSGTLLIEAAQQALAIAPGRARSFGFERLKPFDGIAWADLRRDAARESQERMAALRAGAFACHIAGSDIDARAIARGRRNIEQAGLPVDLIRIGVTDLASDNYLPPWKNLPDGPAAAGVRPRGMIVSNPPYGARMTAVRSYPVETPREERQAEPRRPLSGRISLPVRAAGNLPGSGRRPPLTGRSTVQPANAVEHDWQDQGGMPHAEVMRRCGQALQRWFVGWSIHLISTDPELPGQLGLHTEGRPQSLYNGAMACQFHRFTVGEPIAESAARAEPAQMNRQASGDNQNAIAGQASGDTQNAIAGQAPTT
jgi:putative N6-adenine-specific DNA methylase